MLYILYSLYWLSISLSYQLTFYLDHLNMAQVPRPDPFPNAEKAWVEPEEGRCWWCESTQLLITSNDTLFQKILIRIPLEMDQFVSNLLLNAQKRGRPTASDLKGEMDQSRIIKNHSFFLCFPFAMEYYKRILSIFQKLHSVVCTFALPHVFSRFFQFIFSVSFFDFGPSYFMNLLRYLKVINQVGWMPICAHFS